MTSDNVVSFRLDQDLLSWIDLQCSLTNQKRSEFMKQLIQQAKNSSFTPPEDPLAGVRKQEDPVKFLKERAEKLLGRAHMATLGDGGEGPIYVQKTSRRLMVDIETAIHKLPEHTEALRTIYAILSDLSELDLGDPANSGAVARLKARLKEVPA